MAAKRNRTAKRTRRSSTTRKRSKASTHARQAKTATTVRRVTTEGRAGAKSRSTSGLAPGMQSVNPYLAVANVAATMAFMERALGFTRGVVLPETDGQLRYAEMRHGDSVVMLVRKGDETTASAGAAALYAYVDDVDRALMQAREAGAGVSDAEDRAWGDRAAVITDPDGYRWVLATFKKLAPFS
jgi:uncharacterized glyoxalase superfamily protein PhnB